MRMTKKQAGEYITNRCNWRLVQDGEYVKVYRLDFGDCHFVDVCHKRIKDMIAVYTGHEPEVDFSGHSFYEYDTNHECLTYGTSENHMIEDIWKEAKKIV
ncbi:MAG: hypothetical protein IJH14_06640 [Solobacterium sp.]|nr:hypothetical protein [Solobacterium sp.]